MKGFDDHLDNYGDPGGNGMYSDSEWDHEPQDYYPGSDDEAEDWTETNEILASPHTMSAIAEGESELNDGITTDDFDNWPKGREFPA